MRYLFEMFTSWAIVADVWYVVHAQSFSGANKNQSFPAKAQIVASTYVNHICFQVFAFDEYPGR